jgi:hypothetical protein
MAVLAVAVTATTTAVVGPVYAASAGESTLQQVLSSADPADTGLHVQAETDLTADPLSPITRLLPAGFTPAYPTGIPTLFVATRMQPPAPAEPVVSHVVWRQGACEHLRLTAGRCPQGTDEVVVSARTAVPLHHLRVGSVVAVDGLPTDQPSLDSGGVPLPGPSLLHVVGTYQPRDVDDPFWFGHNFFGAHLGSGGDGEGPDTVDDLFVDRPAFDNASAGTQGVAWVDYPLDPQKVQLSTVGRLRAVVAAAQHDFPTSGHPTMTTGLPRVLDRARHARAGLDSGTALVTAQLLMLAWLVLFEVVAASAESRAPEIAIAKLRGLRPRDAATFGLAEPVLLVAVAGPLGILFGWLASRALAGAVLVDGVPVRVGAAAWGAAALALVGGVVATVLATRRILNRPILDQWRRAEEHVSRGRRTLVVDAVISAVAVLGVVLLARRGALDDKDPSTLTLLGPALLVLAVALVGIRLLPVIGRWGADLTRSSRHLGAFLAVRQVARRATEHRFAVLLAVASGVAVFSVVANDVVRHNETVRARAEVGAEAVVDVQPQAGVDLLTAVSTVDPTGRWAFAGDVWTPFGGTVGSQLQTVDISRFARLGYGADDAVRRHFPDLVSHAAHSAVVHTDTLRVTTTITGVVGAPTLDPTLVDSRNRTVVVHGPAVRRGTETVSIAVPCVAGCRLVGLDLDRDVLNFTTMVGTWTVANVEQRTAGGWSRVDAQLTTRGAWRAGRKETSGVDSLVADARGTTDRFSAESGGWPSIELADLPRPLPVALTANSTPTTDTAPFVNDPVGRQVQLRRAATVARVPRLLGTGGFADLAAAQEALPAFDRQGQPQVWLGPAAPKDALERLRAAGLVPGRPDTVARHLETLRQQGPALALQLFLFASFACSALALAAAALALAAAGRRRSFEMAALLAVGVRRGSLLRACVTEQLLLLGAGLVLGVVPGLAAAKVALPSVPEFADTSPVPLSYAPTLTVVVVAVAALVLVVGAVAVVGGAALLRAAVPSRLREATP